MNKKQRQGMCQEIAALAEQLNGKDLQALWLRAKWVGILRDTTPPAGVDDESWCEMRWAEIERTIPPEEQERQRVIDIVQDIQPTDIKTLLAFVRGFWLRRLTRPKQKKSAAKK